MTLSAYCLHRDMVQHWLAVWRLQRPEMALAWFQVRYEQPNHWWLEARFA